MRVVAVINQKGGVGKTTISTNLASYVSQKNHKTLLLDLDPQAHASSLFDEEKAGSEKIFENKKTNINDLVTNCDQRLSYIPTSIHLAMAAEQVAGRIHREKILHNSLQKLEGFDYVFIDCPPTLGVLSINAIYASDFFVIPVNYNRFSLSGMMDLFDVIQEVKEQEYEQMNYRIIRNGLDPRNSISKVMIDAEIRSFKFFETAIRKCEVINHAQNQKQFLYDWPGESNADEDFITLTREFLELFNDDNARAKAQEKTWHI